MIRPVDIAALNLLTEHDDVVTYTSALMQVERPESNEEKFWFPTPESPGNELEHSPIQKRILKKLRELTELEKPDPTQNEESRNTNTRKDGDRLEDTIVEFTDIFARH